MQGWLIALRIDLMSASESYLYLKRQGIGVTLYPANADGDSCLAGVRGAAAGVAPVREQRVLEPQEPHSAGCQLTGHPQAAGIGITPLPAVHMQPVRLSHSGTRRL